MISTWWFTLLPNQAQTIISSDLRQFLKEKSPGYMIPAYVILDLTADTHWQSGIAVPHLRPIHLTDKEDYVATPEPLSRRCGNLG